MSLVVAVIHETNRKGVNTLALLSDLKLSNAVKSESRNPVISRRHKLIERIFEQLRLVEATKSGDPSQAYRVVRRKGADAGEVDFVQSDRRVSPWWWLASDGKWYLRIKYGSQVLELAKGKSSIQVDGIGGVEGTLRLIGEATERGELDDLLTSAGNSLRKRFQH